MFYQNYIATWDHVKLNGYDPSEIKKIPSLATGAHTKVRNITKSILCMNTLKKRNNEKDLKGWLITNRLMGEDHGSFFQLLVKLTSCIIRCPAMTITAKDNNLTIGAFLEPHKHYIRSETIYAEDTTENTTEFGAMWLHSRGKLLTKDDIWTKRLMEYKRPFKLNQIFKDPSDVKFYMEDGETDEADDDEDDEETVEADDDHDDEEDEEDEL